MRIYIKLLVLEKYIRSELSLARNLFYMSFCIKALKIVLLELYIMLAERKRRQRMDVQKDAEYNAYRCFADAKLT